LIFCFFLCHVSVSFKIMTKPIQISVSILCSDFSRLSEEIKKIESSGADRIHVDVMDGHFVAPITVGPLIVKAIRPLTKLPIDAHLMVDHPSDHIEEFAKAGADAIMVHAECYGRRRPQCASYGDFPKEVDRIEYDALRPDIEAIKNSGKKAFLVFNPGTPVELGPLAAELDGVLVMSVNPGFAHQQFMPVALSKIEKLSRTFSGDISVDGGINGLTAPQAVKAGANILATASYFFGAHDPKELVREMKSLGLS